MQLLTHRPRLLTAYPLPTSSSRGRRQRLPYYCQCRTQPGAVSYFTLYYLEVWNSSNRRRTRSFDGYYIIKTTAGKVESYRCSAVTSLELCCLCCLVLVSVTTTTVDANLQLDHHRHPLVRLDKPHHNYFDRRQNDTEISAHIRRNSKIRTSTVSIDSEHQRSDSIYHKIIVRRDTRGELADDDKRLIEDDVDRVTTSPTPEHTSLSSTTSKGSVLPANVATPAVLQRDPMSPVHPDTMDTVGSNVAVFVLVVALVLATLGVLTCILSTYRYRTGGGAGGDAAAAGGGGGVGGGGGGGHMGGRARSGWPHHHHHHHHHHHQMSSETPALLGSNANLPMLSLPGGMCDDRLSHDMAALRDHHVRLKSVKQDMELDLPPSIRLPDGEELPYGCATRLHIRDPEQESEIYQKCVRPPPNRTVYDSESPPPYRSSSAGLLTHPCVDWSSESSQVIRCHSMSSGSTTPAPSVVVPSRSRRLSAFTDAAPARTGALSTLTMVPCHGRPAPPESV